MEKEKMAYNFSSIPIQQPIGYGYLLGLYWMKEAQAVTSPDKANYYLPAKALLSACLAISKYVNVVGDKVDPHWKETNKDTAPIKERLAHIHQSLDLPLNFRQAPWKDVLLLFVLREELNRHTLTSVYGANEDTVPAVFRVVAQNFPVRLTQAIAEETIELLLSISK